MYYIFYKLKIIDHQNKYNEEFLIIARINKM